MYFACCCLIEGSRADCMHTQQQRNLTIVSEFKSDEFIEAKRVYVVLVSVCIAWCSMYLQAEGECWGGRQDALIASSLALGSPFCQIVISSFRPKTTLPAVGGNCQCLV